MQNKAAILFEIHCYIKHIHFGMPSAGKDPSLSLRMTASKKTNSSEISLEAVCVGVELSFQSVARQVLSPLVSLTSVFGMGTGGPSPLKTPTIFGTYQIYTIQFPLSRDSLRMVSHPQGWYTFRDSNPGHPD